MNSPFPGMDPYLEDPAFWPDFHLTFIGCWREAIADVLPEPYEARLDETVQLVPMSEEVIKLVYPDVAVSRSRKRRKPAARSNGAVAVAEPVIIAHELVEEVRQARIEILHRSDRSLVAVLEMLSPTNKLGEGFADFCAKRLALLRRKVHVVELDLLIGGRRLPHSEPLPPGDYYLLISRGDKRPECEVYPWGLRHPLPTIPIPLRRPDDDVQVALQDVFQETYRRGRYGRSLRYGQPPLAPLKSDDKRWARDQARKARSGGN